MRPAPDRPRPHVLAACVAALLAQLVVLYSPSGVGGGLPHLDKVVHAVFGAPVVLAAAAGLSWRVLLVVLAVHAPVSELVQHQVLPGRSGDPVDVAADLAGLGLATALISWWPPTGPMRGARDLGDDAEGWSGAAGGDHRPAHRVPSAPETRPDPASWPTETRLPMDYERGSHAQEYAQEHAQEAGQDRRQVALERREEGRGAQDARRCAAVPGRAAAPRGPGRGADEGGAARPPRRPAAP